jgi:lysophospholipase L1-like esterase
MRTRIKYLIFSLIPLLTLVVAMECFLQLAGMGAPFTDTLAMWNAPLEVLVKDPYTSYRLKPNANLGSITLNSLGYRDDELNHGAPVKILCLGDSVAFGWGVHDYQKTYAGQLEKILSNQGGGGYRAIEIFNAGIPSYQLYQGFQLYLHYLASLEKWDYVICSFAWNENLNLENETESRELEFTRRNPPDENTILRWGRQSVGRLRSYNVLESLYTRTFLSSKMAGREYPFVRYDNLLTDLARAVRSNNSRLILLSAQVREEDKRNSHGLPILKLNAIAKKVADRENIPYVDTDPAFSQKKPGWYDNVHYDENGHRITAEVLGQVLATELDLQEHG